MAAANSLSIMLIKITSLQPNFSAAFPAAFSSLAFHHPPQVCSELLGWRWRRSSLPRRANVPYRGRTTGSVSLVKQRQGEDPFVSGFSNPPSGWQTAA